MAKKLGKKPSGNGSHHPAKDGAKPKVGFRKVRIAQDVPDDHVAEYANHFIVQHAGKEFYLSFFQIQPPFLIPDQPESEKKFKEMTEVKARFVSQVVVSPEFVSAIVRVLSDNLEKFQARASGQVQEVDLDQAIGSK